MTDVIVVGAGPTGMTLAGELALAGVEVAVLERRASPELIGSRAGGIHSRTIEILDQRGIAQRFLAAGRIGQTARFANTTLDISDFPTRHPYGLSLWQKEMEPLLLTWIEGLGVTVQWGHDVSGISQDDDGVDVSFDGRSPMRTRYLVGADGGRSTIRRAAGIDFSGSEATRSNLIAEVEVTDEPPAGVRQDEKGIHGLALMDNGHTYRVVTVEREVVTAAEPTLADLSAALVAVYGTDFGVHDPTWLSRFSDATRQAASYREGRILLAGDAAHIHYPAGGQGVGLGIQDAVNLGWKLGQVVSGVSQATLLDTYGSERRPAAARALKHSMAQAVLQRQDPRTAAVAETVDSLMAMTEPRTSIAALIHGLDVAYDGDDASPVVGRRMPDLTLVARAGETRVFELMHDAVPLLLDLDGRDRSGLLPAGSRVRRVGGRVEGPCVLPVIGEIPSPSALLIRPDGHVAWATTGSDDGLAKAARRWFGDLDSP